MRRRRPSSPAALARLLVLPMLAATLAVPAALAGPALATPADCHSSGKSVQSAAALHSPSKDGAHGRRWN